jgi:cytochrome c oxidase subunit I
MVLSWLMRIHLGWTNAAIPGLHLLTKNGAPGDIMTPEFYLQLMTMHATIMVFFVLTTAPFAAFGNYFLPIQVGAEDMPFPHFNMMSFWVTFVGFLVLVSSFFVGTGPTLGGWTQYAPLSALGEVGGPGEGTGVVLWALSIAIFCVGQLLGSLNFITTTLDMRTKGMSLWRLPLSAWAWFITSCMGLTAFAVLMPACILLILDHVAGTSFFVASNIVINDQMQPHSGGSTLLWQHLFWFFGHPEVYIAIVPGMGIVSHVLITNMRKPMLSHRVLIYSMGLLAVLSYMVYGHHMFVSGMNPVSSLAFSFPTLVITIPSTIVVLIWLGSLYGAKLRINSASLFALGFISMFIAGGVSGFFLAQPSIDIMLHATYFRGRSLPPGDGRRGDVRNFCRNLLLVPQNVWPHDERNPGQGSLLVELRRGLRHFHAIPLLGSGGKCPPLSGVLARLHAAAHPPAQIHYRGRDHNRCGTADLRIQPDPQPLLGRSRVGQSVASNFAGMEHAHHAAAPQ